MSGKKPSLRDSLADKTKDLGAMLDEPRPAEQTPANKPPITMPGRLMEFSHIRGDLDAKIAGLELELREAKEKGGALDLDLDLLVEVPGRRRKLSVDAYAELRENLRQHPLITPVTVKPLGDGRYEIVSGHNRVAIYRELGRKTIKAWPSDTDNDKTGELAFYANLLHTDLPAYEKYMGLCLIKLHNPHLNTLDALAARTGISRSTIDELMSFDALPAAAHAELAKKPELLGVKTAVKLAGSVAKGGEGAVVEAIRAAAQAEAPMEQKDILRLAEGKPSGPKAEKPAAVVIKAGRKNYCNVVGANKTVRIEFASEQQRISAEQRIADLLEQLAKEED